MRTEILAFLVLGLLLALLFFLSGRQWRDYQEKFLPSSSIDAERETESAEGEAALAALALGDFTRDLNRGGMAERLERISDSLSAVLDELDSHRERLETASMKMRSGGALEDDRFDQAFFHAARAFQELERAAGNALIEVDSTRLRLFGKTQHNARAEQATRILWVSPSRVGVREVCQSCHRPLEGGRMMLIPDEEPEEYPLPMLQHRPEEFGCTVCHGGSPQALDFERAHGDDPVGRPFRPGRLALKSCGLCHAEASPSRTSSLPFEWPEDCTGCHAGHDLAKTTPGSLLPPYRKSDLLHSDLELRGWLLRHWAENTGHMPEREEFEAAVSMLQAGSGRAGTIFPAAALDTAPAVSPSASRGQALACPTCGRKFKAAGELNDYYCPVDGAHLENPGIE